MSYVRKAEWYQEYTNMCSHTCTWHYIEYNFSITFNIMDKTKDIMLHMGGFLCTFHCANTLFVKLYNGVNYKGVFIQ